jgi:hypothetical protein
VSIFFYFFLIKIYLRSGKNKKEPKKRKCPLTIATFNSIIASIGITGFNNAIGYLYKPVHNSSQCKLLWLAFRQETLIQRFAGNAFANSNFSTYARYGLKQMERLMPLNICAILIS